MDEYPVIDLSHLLPAAQGLARLPADERIQRIRADRWIGYPRAVEALNRLETLYAWPNKQRMPNLLLVGPTNNGNWFPHLHAQMVRGSFAHVDGYGAFSVSNQRKFPDPFRFWPPQYDYAHA